jgi:hypothetical protein
MATKEEIKWADSLNKAMSMPSSYSWDATARNYAIKKAWNNKPKSLSYLKAAKLASKRLKSSGGSGG